MKIQDKARVHRVGDLVAIYTPDMEETLYLPAFIAEELGRTLCKYGFDVARVPFTRSEVGTTEINYPVQS